MKNDLPQAASDYAGKKYGWPSYYAKISEKSFKAGAKWRKKRMYSEDEVSRLLETQRGNCYVSVLTACRDEEIATACVKAPEPGGDQWKKSKNQ